MINLSKGQKINLSKDTPGLTELTLGMIWGANTYDGGYDFDLDITAFMLDSSEKVPTEDKLVGYMNPNNQDNEGSVIYGGDNTKGNTSTDNKKDEFEEKLVIDLTKVSPTIQKIVVVCTIYDAETRHQNFGQVPNSFAKMKNNKTGTIECSFDLGEDFSCETAINVGEFYRQGNDWKFNAVGAGFSGGLAEFCRKYSLDVA